MYVPTQVIGLALCMFLCQRQNDVATNGNVPT